MAAKFSISVNEKTLEELEKIVIKEDRKRNWLINKAIEAFIEDYNNKEGCN